MLIANNVAFALQSRGTKKKKNRNLRLYLIHEQRNVTVSFSFFSFFPTNQTRPDRKRKNLKRNERHRMKTVHLTISNPENKKQIARIKV
jgi:hypothetical protein